MPTVHCPTKKSARNLGLSALADQRRRELLVILSEREAAMSLDEVVRQVAAAEKGETSVTEASEATRAIRQDLRHVQLPKLAEAGLVSWEPDSETVTPLAHPNLTDETLQRLLEDETGGVDDLFSVLADQRRRVVVAVLDGLDAPVDRRELARETARREQEDDPHSDAVDEVAGSLHHVHLPKLESVGIVSYEAETGRIEECNVPEIATAILEWASVVSRFGVSGRHDRADQGTHTEGQVWD